jgi:hypothetical protein
VKASSDWWWFREWPVWQLGPSSSTCSDDGTVRLMTSTGTQRVVSAGLARDAYAYGYRDREWALIVGPRTDELVLLDGADGRLIVMNGLQRLPMLVGDDAYDPGGMERIEFRRLGPDEVLVETEIALARIHRHHGFVWQTFHDNISCRITSIDTEAVWFHCDCDAFGIRLSDGQTLFSKTAEPPGSDAA